MMDQSLQEYLELLKSKGWRVELWAATPPALDASFTSRYPRIPADYLGFLQRVKVCENADETVWFLCIDDYNGTNESEWSWSSMEEMDLDGEDDEMRRGEVVGFWNRHMPFMLSVGGEYAYLAFRVGEEPHGVVVEGWEVLTEPSERAKSFEEFVRLHSEAVQGTIGNNMLFDYV